MYTPKQTKPERFKSHKWAVVQWPIHQLSVFARTDLGQSLLGSVLISFSSLVKVPLQPMSMTLQSLAVFYLGLVLSPSNAMRAVILYISWGVAGLPVLARGGGLQAVLYPGAGFLFGLVVAAGTVAVMRSWQPRAGWIKRYFFVTVGQICLYTLGTLGLCLTMPWDMAIRGGVLPFLSTIPLKAALAATLSQYSSFWKTGR